MASISQTSTNATAAEKLRLVEASVKDYPELSNLPATATRLAREISTLPILRSLDLRLGRKLKTLDSRIQPTNLEASLAYIRGFPRSIPCTSCADTKRPGGPFQECVILQGRFKGSCTNCWYSRAGPRCSFRRESLESWDGNPADERWLPKGRVNFSRDETRRAAYHGSVSLKDFVASVPADTPDSGQSSSCSIESIPVGRSPGRPKSKGREIDETGAAGRIRRPETRIGSPPETMAPRRNRAEIASAGPANSPKHRLDNRRILKAKRRSSHRRPRISRFDAVVAEALTMTPGERQKQLADLHFRISAIHEADRRDLQDEIIADSNEDYDSDGFD